MYCPNCELEIKGDDQKNCPLCNAALVENPFESPPSSDDFSETELRLKELIRDIDEKVSKNLEEVSEEQAFSLEEGAAREAEPSANEFTLNLDTDKGSAPADTLEAGVFNLPEEQPAAPEQPLEPVFDLSDITAPESSSSTTASAEPSSPETIATATPAGTNQSAAPEKIPAIELEDTVEMARFNIKPTPAQPEQQAITTSTKEILDKALEELETEQPAPSAPKKRSLAVPLLIGALMLVVVCAAGFYFLKLQTESAVPPPKQAPVVMKKARSTPAPKQKAAMDNATRMVGTPTTIAASAETTAPATTTTLLPEQQPSPVTPEPVQTSQPAVSAPTPGAASVKEPPAQPQAAEQPKPVIEQKTEIAAPPQKFAVVEKTAAPRTAPGLFSIHAGSFRSEKIANQEVKRFEAAGYDAYAEKTDLGPKGIWYRVKIGSFSSREQAERALQQFLIKEPGDARVIRNK